MDDVVVSSVAFKKSKLIGEGGGRSYNSCDVVRSSPSPNPDSPRVVLAAEPNSSGTCQSDVLANLTRSEAFENGLSEYSFAEMLKSHFINISSHSLILISTF